MEAIINKFQKINDIYFAKVLCPDCGLEHNVSHKNFYAQVKGKRNCSLRCLICGHIKSGETRRNQKNHPIVSSETKLKHTIVMKKRWSNGEFASLMSNPDRMDKIKKGIREAWGEGKYKHIDWKKINKKTPEALKKFFETSRIKPNKLELKMQNILNQIAPNEYRYVGNGKLIIDGKCPDFVNINGQKKLIEVWGDYWHKGENPQDRINVFNKFGYKTLVVWESEIKNPDNCFERIRQFHLDGGKDALEIN